MTREEAAAEMVKFPARIASVKDKITAVARGLIPVLRDAGREHSAKELDALFFELDAIEQEMQAFVRDNLPSVMKIITERLEGLR
jgi:hypothetical protein